MVGICNKLVELMKELFAILEIAPTEDFNKVKDAIRNKLLAWHPDKNVGAPDQQEKADKFLRLRDLSEDLNESTFVTLLKAEEKAQSVSSPLAQGVQTDSVRQAYAQTFRDVSGHQDELKVEVHNTGQVEIYLSLHMLNLSSREKRLTRSRGYGYSWARTTPSMMSIEQFNEHFPGMVFVNDRNSELSKAEFIAGIDLNAYAAGINALTQQGMHKVGITDEEAVDIVNEHGHFYPKLIVALTVPSSYVIDMKLSPDDLAGRQLIRGEKPYYWLKSGVNVSAEMITSIRSMRLNLRRSGKNEYRNSLRFNRGGVVGSYDNVEEVFNNMWPFNCTIRADHGVLSLEVKQARRVRRSTVAKLTSLFNRSALVEAPKDTMLTITYGGNSEVTTSALKTCYLKKNGSARKANEIFGVKAEFPLEQAIDNLRLRALEKDGASYDTLNEMGLIKHAATNASATDEEKMQQPAIQYSS